MSTSLPLSNVLNSYWYSIEKSLCNAFDACSAVHFLRSIPVTIFDKKYTPMYLKEETVSSFSL